MAALIKEMEERNKYIYIYIPPKPGENLEERF